MSESQDWKRRMVDLCGGWQITDAIAYVMQRGWHYALESNTNYHEHDPFTHGGAVFGEGIGSNNQRFGHADNPTEALALAVLHAVDASTGE